ncbi:MAG TPA: preprotein translocase subunit SecA, partial [Chloroflexota bacterium]|nr:preprotein translocase subunit SecA [Chloroflexota bacterium]
MLSWVTKVLGDSSEREIKKVQPIVGEINALGDEMEARSDDDLRALTDEFRDRLADGATVDDILPEAYAAVREASRRTIGQRHFDVQLIGGIILNRRKIGELKTGEGKTLMATLPLYLNALEGEGAHLVTVNDYLAKRDAQWMGPIYHLLGLSVGVVQHESAYLFDPTFPGDDPRLRYLRPIPRADAYRADITYGTNNEFGFDYLRDNMVVDLRQCVQRKLHFAVVDEIDNILIDEARTPLIISAQGEQATDRYFLFARLVPRLVHESDFKIDEKVRSVMLTEEGISKVERQLNLDNLYSAENYELTHYLEQALKAQYIFRRDRDYVLVRDGKV